MMLARFLEMNEVGVMCDMCGFWLEFVVWGLVGLDISLCWVDVFNMFSFELWYRIAGNCLQVQRVINSYGANVAKHRISKLPWLYLMHGYDIKVPPGAGVDECELLTNGEFIFKQSTY